MRDNSNYLFKRTQVAAAVLAWTALIAAPVMAEEVADDLAEVEVSAAKVMNYDVDVVAVTQVAQAGSGEQAGAESAEEAALEEVVVTGSQIRGAQLNDALSVSVIDADDIEHS